LLKLSPQQQARRDKFKRGKLTDHERCWRDYRGDHQFEIKAKAVQDAAVSSHFPDAPVMKTQQWDRTVRS
jgi:hypothetical protein